MGKVPDPASRPAKCPLTAAGFQADAEGGMESPMWVEADDLDMEPCVQDEDRSHGTAAPSIGDCNMDCCHCALRWYARRIINQREN
jgi:hypothetical protein